MISLAEPFNPDLKTAIYTKEGELSKVENLIPLFFSLKSGIYIDSLAPNEKIVIYDARVPIGWSFVISSFISLASYVLIVLLANMKLVKGFKALVYKMNHSFENRRYHGIGIIEMTEATILELLTKMKMSVILSLVLA